jgi:hypothetical protein
MPGAAMGELSHQEMGIGGWRFGVGDSAGRMVRKPHQGSTDAVKWKEEKNHEATKDTEWGIQEEKETTDEHGQEENAKAAISCVRTQSNGGECRQERKYPQSLMPRCGTRNDENRPL